MKKGAIILLLGLAMFSSKVYSQGVDVQTVFNEMTRDTIVPENYDMSISIDFVNNSVNYLFNIVCYYKVDNGPVVMDSDKVFYGVAGIPNDFTFHQRWHTPSTPGMHTITVWNTDVNRMPDPDSTNDTATMQIRVAGPDEVVPRTVVFQAFTSTTCDPCSTYYAWLFKNLPPYNPNKPGSRLAYVAYHTDVPGSDPSHNLDAQEKMDQYGIPGNPEMFVDEFCEVNPFFTIGPYPDSLAIHPYIDRISTVEMTTTFTTSANTVNVHVDVTPLATLPDSGYYLFIAVVEEHTGDIGIMRKMLPDGNGTKMSKIIAHQTQSFDQSYTFQVGNVTDGSFNLWGNIDSIAVVAFVGKNTSNDTILQASIANSPTGINEIYKDENFWLVYPNPNNGHFTLNIDRPCNQMTIELLNIDGIKLFYEQLKNVQSVHKEFDLYNLSKGVYFLKISSEDAVEIKRIVVQ